MAEEKKTYEDVTLKCVDCGKEFVLTGGERKYFAEKGFCEPKRCPDCRHARKLAREAAKAKAEKK